MTEGDSSLRLRPIASLFFFISAYSPLLLILVIKDYGAQNPAWHPQHFIVSGCLLFMALVSVCIVLHSAKEVRGGLTVKIHRATDRSGEMFGYTVPYLIAFLSIELNDWRTLLSLFLFMFVLFVMAYRTQTVFVNPVLAMAGYTLVECSFERDGKKIEAMIITKTPIDAGNTCRVERLSRYLYITAKNNDERGRRK